MPLIVDIKVVPVSGRIGCKLEGAGLKCFLKSSAEKGKANKELVAYFAKKLRLAGNKVHLISGATSRRKRIKIDAELSFEQLCDGLGIERQITIF